MAALGWRAWPPRLADQPIFYAVLDHWYATKIAREWNVPAEGVGYVTRFDVERSYLGRYEVHQAGGRDVLEYWIPAEELADLNAHIVGAIIEEAEYRGPVNDQEFTNADKALGRSLPAAWRTYLQGESWFRREPTFGSTRHARCSSCMTHGTKPPMSILASRSSAVTAHVKACARPAQRPAPVLLADITSSGWESVIRQADDVSQLIDRIEAGTFEFNFED